MILMRSSKVLIFIFYYFTVEGNVIKNDTVVSSSTISILDPQPASAQDHINVYKQKVCSGEPTCNVIDQMPRFYHSMSMRNCMCDSDCTLFGDCCSDSPFYNETQQKLVHGTFDCNTVDRTFRLYIKNKCPTNFNDSNVKTKCEAWSANLKSVDRKFVAPVTNLATVVTYANEYCALCNQDENVVAWSVFYECGFPDYTWREESSAKFDAETNTFYVVFNGTRGDCVQRRTPPPNLKSPFRNCHFNVWSCPQNATQTIAELCKTATYIVYDKKFIAYKNVHCAACNGIRNVANCMEMAVVPYTLLSKSFTVYDKASGSGNPCVESTDPSIREKFCS